MAIRIGNPRVGHRIGGFYVSAPLTGRNAGKQIRVGHRLPGGFYASVPIRATGSRRPRRPPRTIGSLPRWSMITATVVYVVLALLLLVVGVWFLAVPMLVGTVLAWLRWAANPQQRRPAHPAPEGTQP